MSAPNPHRPLCSFGVITDIHYADSDDCSNYEGTRQRSFRRSSQLVETAVTEWSAIQDNPVDFILQLGDLIDGRNFSMNASDAALSVMIQQFSRLHQPIYHIFGNHELYNFSRAHLLQHPWLRVSPNVATPNPGHTAHYHFSPVEGFRVVILDQYEFSMLGYEEDDETFRMAKALLIQHNRNDDLNSPNGLTGDSRRFVKFNGGVSENQLRWLDELLRMAQLNEELVIVAGHVPLLMEVSDNVCLCWHYKEILQILHRYPCVLAYFAGHAHDFAYGRDSNGLLHVTFPGVIETLPGHSTAHASVSVFGDRAIITSHDSAMPDVIELTRL